MSSIRTRSSSRKVSQTPNTEMAQTRRSIKATEKDPIHISPTKTGILKALESKTPTKRKLNKCISVTPKNKSDIYTDPVTPSTLIRKLSLVTPSKRKHLTKKLYPESDEDSKEINVNEVGRLAGGKSPPKQQKLENEENTPSSCERLGIYQNARRALHSTFPNNMPSREKELEELKNFINTHLVNESSGTLYISGPPGTGKTASLNLVLQEKKIASKVCYTYVNCTSIKSAGSVYSRIIKDLDIKTNGKIERDFVVAIEKYLDKKHKTILLVLDEIDQLESKNQSILYTIFEWPARLNSKLILIGIANALDLTDRILPRLQARCELKPKLMHFAPYTKQQIVEIFTSRLKSAGVLEVFSPVALQMLAAKVSAVSGDLRRALDIGRRVIELVDTNAKDPLKPLENLEKELDKEGEKLKVVDIKQVVSALNNVYGASSTFSDNVDDAFPLQQKIILCTLVLMLKKAKNKDVTVGRLHEVYRRVCSKRNLQVVDQGEFVGLCSLIETKGIIKIIKKKDQRLSKIGLQWNEDEIAATLGDKQLLSMILQDENCLGNM